MASIVVEEVSSGENSSKLSDLKDISESNFEIENLILSPDMSRNIEQPSEIKEEQNNSIN